MAEIAFTPESSASPSPSSSSREETAQLLEKRLPGCLRRKFLPYAQLPARCRKAGRYYRPCGASFRLTDLPTVKRASAISTTKSCPDSTCSIVHLIGARHGKKSWSMIDLSPLVMDNENGDLRSDSSSIVERIDDSDKNRDLNEPGIGITQWMDGFAVTDPDEPVSQFIQNPKRAASIVCHVLMLNAWRRRRSELGYLHCTIDGLTQQIENLHLQIVVLRRLLDRENGRVGLLTGEVHRAKLQCDETQKEKDTLKAEKERMQGEIERLNELSVTRQVAVENVRNELLTARDQLRALDEQIVKDREKLLKLREDKRMLLEKMTACETLAAERGTRADKAEAMVEDLQIKLATQATLLKSSQDQMERHLQEAKSKDEEKCKLLMQLQSVQETGRVLNLRTITLEAQLLDRRAALQRMQAAYNSQLTELNELKERLVRQTQEGGWSSRMLQIAGSVVRAPRAILRTLLAGPVLTP